MARASWLQSLLRNLTTPSRKTPYRRDRRLQLEELERREVPSFSQLALDFGTATSPVATGFTRVSSPAYSVSRGYGFNSITNISMIDRGTTNSLTRDFAQGRNEILKADMNNGWYVVTLYTGDATTARKAMQVNAEGLFATKIPATSAGKFAVSTFTVQLFDGQLNIKFLGSSSNKYALNAVTIVPQGLSVSAGPDIAATEGSAVQFQGSAAGQAPLSYQWDFGDGTTASGSATPTKTYADQGTFTATLTVTDSLGVQKSDTTIVTIGNVAPTASFANDGPVNEGSTATVSFANPNDPSSADVAAGFKYSFDFDNNGTFEVLDSSMATATVPASFLADGPSSRTVRGRISDKDGGVNVYTTAITVHNVAPSASITATVSSTNDKTVSFAAAVADPGPADTFTYLWNFGDGVTSTQVAPAHTYAQYGTYTVQLTVTDKDGASGSATKSITLAAAPSSDINVATEAALRQAVNNLQSNQTIVIAAGTYNLTDTLYLPQGITNVTIRGATSNAGDVVIAGAGMSGAIRFGFWVGNVQTITFANFSLKNLKEHGIILNSGVESPVFRNLRLLDIGDQFIKANPDGSGGGVDNGLVELCTLEYTTLAPDTYTNGVDVHTGANWIIRNNTFRNFRSQSGLAGPAILVWNASRNTLTENNIFVNNAREIAYGLDSATPNDHSGGIIRNNFIVRNAGTGGDVAIGVWNSPNTKVLHNTVLLNNNYPNAVEYRFANTTGVSIQNNLTDAAIVARDGATGTVANNYTAAQAGWFVNPTAGDLHLKSTATTVIDKVTAPADAANDFDGQSRPTGASADYGADEYTAAVDTSAPAINITAPTNNAAVSGTVNVQATASDNVGVVGVQFYLDGQMIGSEDATSPFALSWNSGQSSNGSHVLTAVARDAAGNSTTSAGVTITVANDAQAPTVSITSPTGSATVSGTVSITANASDNVGVIGVQFMLDGQAIGAEDTTSPYSYSWNSTQVGNGSHTWTAVARDAAGNSTTSASINVTVSNTVSAPAGLVAAYGFNEGAGTTLTDSAGSNHGTISEAAWVANGQFGKALSFDGVNDLVTINDAAALDLTNGMTLEAWVKPSTINGWETVVLKEASGDLAYALYADNNGDDTGGPCRPAVSIRQGSTTYAATGTSQLTLNIWTHLAATYDGAVERFYVNGALAGSVNRTGSINTSTNALRIGGNSIWSEWFNGLIDEVRIYNRALSASEIQSDMNTPVEAAAPDTTAPTVTAVSPTQGATGVSVGSAVQITFSEAMDAATVTGNQIQLRDGSGSVVASAVSYDANSFRATLDPNANLAYSTTYTVSVQGVKDLAGNLLAATFSSSFVTAAAPPQDTSAPTVASISPVNGAMGVNVAAVVSITFSEAMDASTINGNQIQLRDGGGNVIASSVSYDWTSYRATLDPNAALAYSTSYTVSVQGVKDVAGNVLASAFSASFQTSAQPVSSGVDVSSLPLLYQDHLDYLGAFRVPSGTFGASNFDYGGSALAFNPANNSLFIVGHDWDQAVAEISIPQSIVNSSNTSNLATANVLQPFVNIMGRVPNWTLSGTVKVGGLTVVNGQLIGTAYEFYDADVNAVQSHFKLNSLNLATAGVTGLFQVGNLGGGYVGGYMAPIPTEWQAALGAPYLTGQAALNIIGRTSSGPGAFGFDPNALGAATAPITPYVYYPLDMPLGQIDGKNPLFTGTTEIRGVFFAPGSRSVLFFGDNGTNSIGYGEAATFNDNSRGGKGWHSQNGAYTYQVWAYNVNDFVAVQSGQKQPWEIKPYEVWSFDVPQPESSKHLGGVAFDAATGRLYVAQIGGDNQNFAYRPLIHVYQLNMNSAGLQGQQSYPPTIGSLTTSSSTVAAGANFTLTALDVQNASSGASIVGVKFYLDANCDRVLERNLDRFLGNGAQNGTTWSLTASSTGLAAGSYTIFAQAEDSNGSLSDLFTLTLGVI